MPIHPAVCLTIACTNCGYQPWDGELIPHFASLAEAKNRLIDWLWLGDTPLLCGECAAAADCTEFDHDWSGWHDCQCGGTNHQHHGGGCPQIRWCRRCSIPDYAYPATPADHLVATQGAA